MNKKFFVENNSNSNQVTSNFYHPINNMDYNPSTSDRIVNDFLNKNVSLESLIENEIFKIK